MCGNTASTGPCGGQRVTAVPTATCRQSCRHWFPAGPQAGWTAGRKPEAHPTRRRTRAGDRSTGLRPSRAVVTVGISQPLRQCGQFLGGCRREATERLQQGLFSRIELHLRAPTRQYTPVAAIAGLDVRPVALNPVFGTFGESSKLQSGNAPPVTQCGQPQKHSTSDVARAFSQMPLTFWLGQGWDRPFGLSKSLKQREAGETACPTERQK